MDLPAHDLVDGAYFTYKARSCGCGWECEAFRVGEASFEGFPNSDALEVIVGITGSSMLNGFVVEVAGDIGHVGSNGSFTTCALLLPGVCATTERWEWKASPTSAFCQ